MEGNVRIVGEHTTLERAEYSKDVMRKGSGEDAKVWSVKGTIWDAYKVS